VSQDYPEALAYVGLARDRQGKDGGLWIEQAVAQDGQNAVIRFIQGLHLRFEDDLTGSLNALVRAVTLDPQNPAYYAELGTAYQLVGDLENAERWLRVAVEVSNQDVRFQRLLALFYAEELPNLGDASLSDFEMMATLMPDDPEVQAAIAWAAYRAGDNETALAQLDAVLLLVPDHPRSLYYKARIALAGEQWAEARQSTWNHRLMVKRSGC
jgi:tetratricopeptide (TPR) repeat protein